MPESNSIGWIVAGLLLAISTGAWLSLRLASVLDSWRRRRRARRAQRGEHRARDWLIDAGYRILGEQDIRRCTMRVDGDDIEFSVRADFVVERRGRRGVVEVKTGNVATVGAPGTRRQILEYAVVYGVDEVFLFDGDAQRLHAIDLSRVSPARATSGWPWMAWVCGAGCGALAALALSGIAIG